MIKVFLNMKNAKAEGMYDFEKDNINVLKGAIFERQVADSFVTHNYIKLRNKLLNSGKVIDFKSVEDIEFRSLSAASSVIAGRASNGLSEWKLEDGRTVKEFIFYKEKINQFIEYFNANKLRKINPKSVAQAMNIVDIHPIDKLREMKLEDYDKKGSKKSLCYLLEYHTKEISSGMFGSTQNKLFYEYDGEYHNSNFITNKYPNLSIEDRFEIYKDDLYNLVANFDINNYSGLVFNILPSGANYIKSKLVNIYHPNKILSLDSKNILIKIMDYLGLKTSQYIDSLELNIALLKKTHELIPESKNIDPWVISSIYWDFYIEVIDVNNEVIDEEVVDTKTNQIDDLFIDEKTIDEIVLLIKKKKNIILQGSPGVGKTFSIKKIIKNRFNIFDAHEQILMVQFHQSFSYEEFIEGLRPTSYNVGFTVESGIFKQFIDDKVLLNPDKDYFLIIDEINRGNLSKIFGELLMLIEADKRGEQYKVQLPYSKRSFFVPKNLYIIGTMNTADRSLALIDYALRRRFSFIDLIPRYNSTKFNSYLSYMGLKDNEINIVNQTMGSINREIQKDLGSNFEIGHSYFVDSQVEDFDSWYKNIIKYDIVPLLREYYFDDQEKVEKLMIDLGIDI